MTFITRNRNNNAWQLWVQDEYEAVELTSSTDYSLQELLDICNLNGWTPRILG